MAGPGAISTVILTSPGSANWFETTFLISSIAVLGLVTWLCFSYAQLIGKLIGDIGIQLISRIMGLILAALAVEYMVKGIQILFNL
jgi:multiple antibiotic resistance protein